MGWIRIVGKVHESKVLRVILDAALAEGPLCDDVSSEAWVAVGNRNEVVVGREKLDAREASSERA